MWLKRCQDKAQIKVLYVVSTALYWCKNHNFPTSHRSTTWWFCLPTGPMWRMPAGCRSMRTSSQKRSRSFMTSTPLAPRSVSTPTHKDQCEACPCHSGLSLPLSLFYLSVSLYYPLPRGGGWRLGPSPLLMSLVRHTTMWSGGGNVIQILPVTNSIADEKKKPLYLSHGWCYDYQYGSYNIIGYKLFSADSRFSVFVESEVALVFLLF